MAGYTASDLFRLNIQSSEHCRNLHDAIERLGSKHDISWLLRSSIVFSISALDSYFHDKIKYSVAGNNLKVMPEALAELRVPLKALIDFDGAVRKGNVIRNLVEEALSTKPLQKREEIEKALALVGIKRLWTTIEPNQVQREAVFYSLSKWTERRNQIAHEGDRMKSRASGKKLRKITRSEARHCEQFVRGLVFNIERHFPKNGPFSR